MGVCSCIYSSNKPIAAKQALYSQPSSLHSNFTASRRRLRIRSANLRDVVEVLSIHETISTFWTGPLRAVVMSELDPETNQLSERKQRNILIER
jgi:hypothetical protein